MSTSVEELCQALASAFSEGRLDRVADHYVYPLAIYLPQGVRVEMTPEATAEAVFARRGAALRAGMASVGLRIAKVTEKEPGRVTVRLSWEFLDAAGGRIARSSMRYYCRRFQDGTLRVEMIEFTEIAFATVGTGAAPRTAAN